MPKTINGEVWGLSRENLAKLIFRNSMHVGTWESLSKTKGFKDNGFHRLADAIIAEESELLEVKK